MVNAQEYIEKKYPQDGVCKSGSDEKNKGKKRNEITELDLSKGKVGKGLFNDGKILEGSLKLEEFDNLQKLIISSQQITSLDVSECPNLKEVDISNCPKELTENKEAIKSHLVFNIKKTKLVKGPIIILAEENIRNILLVGWTGSGKSTLANSLTNTNEFTESSAGVSETENYQIKDFVWEKDGKTIRYHIVDNIGFGDTRRDLTEEVIFDRIGNAIYSAKEGINQILFVFNGRFSEEHTKGFNLFENFISDTGITKFTTIVKTGFANFRDPKSCERDKKTLLRENEELRTIIESCNDIIYVDNPSVDPNDFDDGVQEINLNKNKRKISREMVLNYLAENCQNIYRIEEWENIHKMMVRYKEIKKNLENNKEETLEKEKTSLFKELRLKLGLNVPGLPIGFEAQIEVIK